MDFWCMPPIMYHYIINKYHEYCKMILCKGYYGNKFNHQSHLLRCFVILHLPDCSIYFIPYTGTDSYIKFLHSRLNFKVRCRTRTWLIENTTEMFHQSSVLLFFCHQDFTSRRSSKIPYYFIECSAVISNNHILCLSSFVLSPFLFYLFWNTS